MADKNTEKSDKITEMFIKEVTSENNEISDLGLAQDL
jgi:hypothetical protein